MADNIGSFGAAIGGGSALEEAMQRRGIDVSALQAQSPASAGGVKTTPSLTIKTLSPVASAT